MLTRIGFILALFFLIACAKKPKYADVPAISFKSFNVINNDSALMTIAFSDGNGDIGADNTQTKNLFMTYYYKDTTTNNYVAYYDNVTNDTLRVAYSIQKPSDAYKNKPISGEISVIMGTYRHSKRIKHFKYVIYILDNAQNKSNIVTTPDLYVP